MDLSDDFDDFASYYKNKLNQPRKSYGTSKRNKFNGVESQTEAVKKLNLLKIPKPAKAILTKLLLTGQLSSVDEILHRSNTAIVLRGKITLLVKKQKSLESENIVIKIFVNGTTEELQTKAKNEYENLRWRKLYFYLYNRPKLNEIIRKKFETSEDAVISIPINGTKEELLFKFDKLRFPSHHVSKDINKSEFIMQIENIVIMSMIGDNEPAMTLQQVLRSNKYQNVLTVFRKVVRLWIDLRHHFRCPKFDPANFLWHDNKWWTVGDTSVLDERDEVEKIKESLNEIVVTFGHYGVSKEELKKEILIYHECFHPDNLDIFLQEDFEEFFNKKKLFELRAIQ
jgi:hypothetical protein